MEQIKVTIGKAGKVNIEALGFTGEGCTLATQGLRNALNKAEGDIELKEEYYEAEKVAIQLEN